MLTIPQALDFPMDENSKEIVNFFFELLKKKNNAIYTHSLQVANYAVSIAANMGLPLPEVAHIKTAALLHDIGLLSIPNALLAKYPFFNTREQASYKRHCVAGCSMLENISDLGPVLKLILHHHETWEGKGYPKRLKGVNIPLGARIIAVADYYDTIINPCTQNWKKTHEDAIKELKRYSGTRFDPEVVNVFFSVLTHKNMKNPVLKELPHKSKKERSS